MRIRLRLTLCLADWLNELKHLFINNNFIWQIVKQREIMYYKYGMVNKSI